MDVWRVAVSRIFSAIIRDQAAALETRIELGAGPRPWSIFQSRSSRRDTLTAWMRETETSKELSAVLALLATKMLWRVTAAICNLVPVALRVPASFTGGHDVPTLYTYCSASTRCSRLEQADHICGYCHRLTRLPVWGADNGEERGPIIAGPAEPRFRNVLGSFAGGYAVYRGLAIATKALDRHHQPDFSNTRAPFEIPQRPRWKNIVSLDPYGFDVQRTFADYLSYGARPTISGTTTRLSMAEIRALLQDGTVKADGAILLDNGEVRCRKISIDPVWHLPGVARRLRISESDLRRELSEETRSPDLVNHPEIEVWCPPIGGSSVYVFGDITRLSDPATIIAARVHDECNGSDVFGADICTCSLTSSTASKSASKPLSKAASASSSTTAKKAALWGK